MKHATQLTWIVPLALIAASGCANYRMGARSVYAPDIQTVYVPMIQSNSYRQFLGEWLTEAVVKKILEVTPYTVVSTAEQADSVLTVRLNSDMKQVLMESFTDEPRELQMTMQVSADWINRNGQQLGQPVNVPLPPTLNPIDQSANIYPELGQSASSAEMRDVELLAEQIVSMMEAPW
jgi:outer membrane lipopolysaccharide assembly protein LptE/RlpB